MVTIKHKVTIKTKTAQEETPTAVKSPVVTIKRKQPEVAPKSKPQPKSDPKLDPKPVTPTAGHEKKSNTGKVVGGIIAAAAILAGIYFLGIKDNGVDSNNGTTIEQTAQAGGTQESGNPNTSDESNTGDDAANTTDTETAKPSEVSETPATTVSDNASVPTKVDKKKADKPSTSETSVPQQTKTAQANLHSTSTTVASATVSGDVEENARRVIRGDFGNGQTRKDKLGASYSEIQGRVNEMYRQGLVH